MKNKLMLVIMIFSVVCIVGFQAEARGARHFHFKPGSGRTLHHRARARHRSFSHHRHGWRHHARRSPERPSLALGRGPSGSSAGMASWYSGWRTASGERFSGGALTAAHRFWPFGTRVLVTNTTSGRSVVVRINDRGPFVRGRIIDLSRSAAQAVGIAGVGRVSLQRL